MNSNINLILLSREERHKKIVSMFENGDFFLITFTLNIPGEEKTSNLIDEVFNKLELLVFKKIKSDFDFIEKEVQKDCAGNVVFYKVKNNKDKYFCKLKLIEIEKSFVFMSQYMDLDIYVSPQIKIARTSDLSLKPRKCFLCDDDAKVCTYKVKHSILELEQKIRKDFISFLGD